MRTRRGLRLVLACAGAIVLIFHAQSQSALRHPSVSGPFFVSLERSLF